MMIINDFVLIHRFFCHPPCFKLLFEKCGLKLGDFCGNKRFLHDLHEMNEPIHIQIHAIGTAFLEPKYDEITLKAAQMKTSVET